MNEKEIEILSFTSFLNQQIAETNFFLIFKDRIITQRISHSHDLHTT